MRARVALSLLVVSASCSPRVGDPRDQWVVTMYTDARVPEIGDRIRIDVLDDNGEECSGCARLLDATLDRTFPISFGIVPSQHGTRVRARLFRSTTIALGGEPPPASTIDTLIALPKPDGVTVLNLVLPTDCFGVEADVSDNLTCDPKTGKLVPITVPHDASLPTVGSWPRDASVPCMGSAPDDTVCIPGGSFVFGDASVQGDDADSEPSPEVLVTLSPFFIDTREMTVGALRPLLAAHPEVPHPLPQGTTEIADSYNCTYLETSTVNDALSVNCFSKAAAIAICKARGMRLPTEAEWEFAAGNGKAETRYAWGTDIDICAHATTAIAGVHGARVCELPDGPLPEWPIPSTGNDISLLGLVDVGGSLSEWVADDFAPYGTECWADAHQMTNPTCSIGGGRSAVKGGNWDDAPIRTEVARRRSLIAAYGYSGVGVRCALSAAE